MKSLGLFLLIFASISSQATVMREQAFGGSCYYLRQKDSLNYCHPTVVAREEGKFFFGNLLFSEQINQSSKWKQVIDGKADASAVLSLIEDDRVSYLMSETNIGVVGNSWALTFKPYDLWARTRIQNPSNPYAQLDAGFAQVVALHLGHYLTDEFSVGVRIEGAQMKVLKRSFFMTDLLVDPNAVDFKPEEKNPIVFSPGIAFEPKDAWADARISILWKQSYVTKKGELYSGVSFYNDISVGMLEWGAGAKMEESEKTEPQIFAHYNMGITTIAASASNSEQTFAAFLQLKKIETGLSYNLTDDDRLLLFQLGFSM